MCLEINGQPKCFAPGEKTALNLPDGHYSAAAWVRVRRRRIYQSLAALRFRTLARVLRVITRELADLCFGVAWPHSASSAAARTPQLDYFLQFHDGTASSRSTTTRSGRVALRPTLAAAAAAAAAARRGCRWAASARSAVTANARVSVALTSSCVPRALVAVPVTPVATASQQRCNAAQQRCHASNTLTTRSQHARDVLATQRISASPSAVQRRPSSVSCRPRPTR